MRILILNYEHPPIGGGGGVISKAIAHGLVRIGHNVVIVTTWFKKLKENDEEQGVKVIRLKSKRRNLFKSNPVEMISWIQECKKFLPEFLKSNVFDLCIANFALPGGEVALFLKKNYSLPFVVISHGHDIPWVKPYIHLGPLHLIAYRRIKKICLQSEKNFVQSDTMLKNINRFLGPLHKTKNIKIPNGIEDCKINKTLSKRSLLRIIFVGRLVSQKDPITLLKAAKNLNTLNIDFSLDIYGDGPLRTKMEKFIKQNGLCSKVVCHGKVLNNEMCHLYRAADLMIAPSISEGMSISIMEALSFGVYVISTKVSGNEELIEDKLNGAFVQEQNPEMLCNAINTYYIQKHLLGYKVPEVYLKKFNAKYNWQNIVSLYEREFSSISKEKKVLHIIDTLWLGGAQMLLKNILECNSSNRMTNLFVMRKTKPTIEVEYCQKEIYHSSSRWSIFPLYRLFRIVSEKNIDVVHCHLPRSQVNGFILKLIFPKLRLVYHEHGDIYEKGWLLPLLLKYFQFKVDLFIACSHSMKETLIKKAKINTAKISVLFNCVKHDFLEESQSLSDKYRNRQEAGINQNAFVVGFAGRIIERKGWADFLKAAKIILTSKSEKGILFIIAGIGPDEGTLKKQIIELGLSNHVQFIGFVDEMSRFYSVVDCCVMPSKWEGLPLVQLEAMSKGVPLITYDGPGMNEVPTNNLDSLTVKSGNIKELADKIIFLKRNSQIGERIKKAAQKTVEKMNPDSYNNNLKRLYNSLF